MTTTEKKNWEEKTRELVQALRDHYSDAPEDTSLILAADIGEITMSSVKGTLFDLSANMAGFMESDGNISGIITMASLMRDVKESLEGGSDSPEDSILEAMAKAAKNKFNA